MIGTGLRDGKKGTTFHFPEVLRLQSSEVAIGILAHINEKLLANSLAMRIHDSLLLETPNGILRPGLTFFLTLKFLHFGFVFQIHISPSQVSSLYAHLASTPDGQLSLDYSTGPTLSWNGNTAFKGFLLVVGIGPAGLPIYLSEGLFPEVGFGS
jgi:hypothetical protein